jgi:hypothetical protein
MFSFVQTTMSAHLERDGDGIGDDKQEAEQNHSTERGPATEVFNSDTTGRPRRSVLSVIA